MLSFLQKNKDITEFSNFKTPARTEYFFELNSQDDIDKLKEIYDFAKDQNLRILMIGGGTNMLFAFDVFEGIVIKNNLRGWTYDNESKILESYSQEMIREIAENLESNYSQDLWHRFIGLPGSVGGAVFGNAGCFGLETENNFLEADVLDISTGKIQVFKKKDMNFLYRSSILKEQEGKYFLIQCRFDLSKKREKYHSDVDNLYFRKYKQPSGNTCGSFFKNPSRDQSAGYLIEEVGLKGYKLGGAIFSEKHANFLMHDGSGKWQDLVQLIELAKEKVKKQFGIDLVNEVRIISN